MYGIDWEEGLGFGIQRLSLSLSLSVCLFLSFSLSLTLFHSLTPPREWEHVHGLRRKVCVSYSFFLFHLEKGSTCRFRGAKSLLSSLATRAAPQLCSCVRVCLRVFVCKRFLLT